MPLWLIPINPETEIKNGELKNMETPYKCKLRQRSTKEEFGTVESLGPADMNNKLQCRYHL